MRRILTTIAVVFSLSSCSQKIGGMASGGGSDAVVATINGVAITDAELTKSAENQLKKLETETYQIKRRALDNLIEEKLLEQGAKDAGLSKEEYLKQNIEAKATDPTDEEVKALYEARKTKDTEAFDKVKDQVRSYLKQTRLARAEQALTSELRNKAEVKVVMEPPRVKVSIDGAPFMGPKDAKVTIVEFSDYQCPFCRRVRPTIQQVLTEYKDDVKYVFRDFPLSFHAQAPKAHEAAYCADDQGKYFEYSARLFEDQSKLTLDDLKEHAKKLQLDAKAFDACLESGKHTAHVQKNIADGADAGVSGTPAFFVNGIQLSGAQPFSAFKELIESELKR